VLTRAENELLTRVGPGTPMGEMLREYWTPALRSAALEADGAPVRVRLLGENFVAFRASDGRVGFFDEGCPHRCTSLALARNEDNALTCIFHGWKIDVSGKVVDVPSEPPERRAEFAAKVRVRHYPVREGGTIVWVYLGKHPDNPPAFFNFEFTSLPADQVYARRAVLHCNWLQGLEARIDASHVGILHSSWLDQPINAGGANLKLAAVNTGPRFEFINRPYGFREGALRDLGDGTVYARIREVVLPYFSFIPADPNGACVLGGAVPIDDEWDVQWYVAYDPVKPLSREFLEYVDRGTTGNPDHFNSDMGTIEDAFHQDRQAMKEGHWSGIVRCIPYEDFATAQGMGLICDRTREYLGSSDQVIIRVRRMLLDGVRAFQAGKPAFGQAQPLDYSRVRATAVRITKDTDWREVDSINPPAHAMPRA